MWLEYLKATEIMVTLIGGGLTTLIGLLLWWDRRWDRRLKQHAEERNDEIGRLDADVESVRQRVEKVEGSVARLASREDVGRLSERVAGLEATMRQVDGKVDTIYRAALWAEGD